MSWHLDGCPHRICFPFLMSKPLRGAQRWDHWALSTYHDGSSRYGGWSPFFIKSSAHSRIWPKPKVKKIKPLHSHKNANDVKLKSLIWIAEERAFQSWHFHRPSKEVGYLRGSIGSFVKPERLCGLSGRRWTDLLLQNISEYNADLTAVCYHLHLTASVCAGC